MGTLNILGFPACLGLQVWRSVSFLQKEHMTPNRPYKKPTPTAERHPNNLNLEYLTPEYLNPTPNKTVGIMGESVSRSSNVTTK